MVLNPSVLKEDRLNWSSPREIGIGKKGVIFYHPCQVTTMKGIPIGRLNDSGHNGKASILLDIFSGKIERFHDFSSMHNEFVLEICKSNK